MSNEQVINVTADKILTSQTFNRYVITKSKDLARALMGMIKGQGEMLGAFAQARTVMKKQLKLYEELQNME